MHGAGQTCAGQYGQANESRRGQTRHAQARDQDAELRKGARRQALPLQLRLEISVTCFRTEQGTAPSNPPLPNGRSPGVSDIPANPTPRNEISPPTLANN